MTNKTYTVPINNKTLAVLKNFSTINPSIYIQGGNVLRTISPTRTIMARAYIDDDFSTNFAIYDLSKFLSVISFFENPSITFESEMSAKISGDSDYRSINYHFAEPSNIVYTEKDPVFDNYDVSFEITKKSLIDVSKAMGILGLPGFAFIGDGSTISIEALDQKKKGSTYSEMLTNSNKKFSIYLSAESIKMLPSDYSVRISTKGLVNFKSAEIEYWVAAENV